MIQSREEPAPEAARYPELDPMNALAEKAREGETTIEERAELESYLHVSDLLTVLQSKARQSLKHPGN